MQLNIVAGEFEEIWQWTENTASNPSGNINAIAYNVIDGIAYGLFSDTYPAGEAYLCRFSHVQNSTACLCKLPHWGFTAAITRDGTYYLAKGGGEQIHKLESVHSIANPPSSPAPVSSLSTCTNFQKVQQGRGTGGAVNIENWGLSLADMDTAYGIDHSSCTEPECTRSYMNVWTESGNAMTTWKPGGQNFADYIDFEYRSITYLIGLGAHDGSVAIIKLTGDGGGDVAGYAYSRVEVDYTGSSSSARTMTGFGAG
jgi:hypothetical protein